MRILHVTDCYLPRLGGIEMHVRDLVLAQRVAGHDARVVTSTRATPGDPEDQPWVDRVAHNSRVRSVLHDVRPDVVHCHVSVVSPLAMAAVRHASDLGLPVLVTVHSLWPSGPSPTGALPRAAGAVLGLARRPVLWSAVSARAAGPVAAALGPGAAPVVLPNAVDPTFWRATPFVRPLDGSPVTIVSVMRLARRKRPLALARMLRQVRAHVPADVPLRAVIVGDGPRRHALERYVGRHLDGWVDVPGLLDRDEIRTLFETASLYVAPATLESFGIAALEARCAGVPVVASSHGGVGEFITSGLDGLLAQDDAAMVRAMARLSTDARLRARMAAHARAVVPPFDWDTACRASLEAYAMAATLVRSPDRFTTVVR